jgi:hypothetical protein
MPSQGDKSVQELHQHTTKVNTCSPKIVLSLPNTSRALRADFCRHMSRSREEFSKRRSTNLPLYKCTYTRGDIGIIISVDAQNENKSRLFKSNQGNDANWIHWNIVWKGAHFVDMYFYVCLPLISMYTFVKVKP